MFAWLAILVGGWLGWQLLRQSGRRLLGLDELEKRLNEIEFGEGDGVLQQQWETSRRYVMFATPIAYLIDEAGVISHDVAVGVEPIHTSTGFEKFSLFAPVQLC